MDNKNIIRGEKDMKLKNIITSGLSVMALCALFCASAQASDISVYVDNVLVESDQAPVILNDRTMVPIRAVFEKAGATVDWADSTKTATIKKEGYTVIIKLNEPYIYKNGVPVALDVPSAVVNDRIVIPVRAIAEAMDLGVTWNSAKNSVLIATDGKPYRANAQWHTGFRDINEAGLVLNCKFSDLQVDLDGDGTVEVVSFTPPVDAAPAALMINDVSFSNFLPSENGGVTAIGFIDICEADGLREIVAVDGDDMRNAWFFRYNGTELVALRSNGSDDGSIQFTQKLFLDGVENIISDRDGICFTDPMICTSVYSIEGTEIKRYSLNPEEMEKKQVKAAFNDQMTFNVKYTDKYEKGKYITGETNSDGIVESASLPHNTMTIEDIEYDSVDPSKFEVFVTFGNNLKAVLWPYNA